MPIPHEMKHEKEVLKIIHVFRSPVGGLFRHVYDLVSEQIKRGHEVGIICDSTTGGDVAEKKLSDLTPGLSLGLSRVPMSRGIGFSDLNAYCHVLKQAKCKNPDVLHGHGAKGGAYSRLVANQINKSGARVTSFYTPHGGSLNFGYNTLSGTIYLTLEKLLRKKTSAVIFESAYAQQMFREKIGQEPALSKVIYNGLLESDFSPNRPKDNASDFLFIGELREIKGIDTLLQAMHRLKEKDVKATLTIVGSGPDELKLKDMASSLELNDRVTFTGQLPAKEAFTRGGCFVVPSRNESMPYVILEACAATMPIIATAVGGIPEILSSPQDRLIPANHVNWLADAMAEFLKNPRPYFEQAIKRMPAIKQTFNVTVMTENVLDVYYSALVAMRGTGSQRNKEGRDV